jgi:thioredoxin reductase
MTQPDVDIAIIGAGPGGLQLAQQLQHLDANYLLIEAADTPGSFFRQYPRHRRLISINKPYVGTQTTSPLRFDWNSLLSDDPSLRFTHYSSDYFPSADALLRYLAHFSARSRLKVLYNTRVLAVEEKTGGYQLNVDRAPPITARRVVIATGMSPSLPAIPGIEHVERYEDFPTEPAGFRNARVLIIGKGNSAFETATSLIPTAATIHLVSPNPVRFAWNTHYVGHLRAINNDLIDTYQLKSGNAVLDAHVTAIRRDGTGLQVDLAYTHANGHRVTYNYDRVIAATGFRFDPAPLAALHIPTCHHGKFPAMTSEYRCPTSPGLYFAGIVMHAIDYRKTMSGFIHGFRYNAKFLAKVLAGGALSAAERIPCDAAVLSELILRRLNDSDALYLQPGFLTDAFVADTHHGLTYYPEVPLSWVREGRAGSGWRITVTLEYGPPAPDPLRVDRSPDPSYAKVTPFLHPVVRVLRGDEELDRLDLLEDLENQYTAEEFLPPLQAFLQTALINWR